MGTSLVSVEIQGDKMIFNKGTANHIEVHRGNPNNQVVDGPIDLLSQLQLFGDFHKSESADLSKISTKLEEFTNERVGNLVNQLNKVQKDNSLNLFGMYTCHINMNTYGYPFNYKKYLLILTELEESGNQSVDDPDRSPSLHGGMHLIPIADQTFYKDGMIEGTVIGGILRVRPINENYDIFSIKQAYLL